MRNLQITKRIIEESISWIGTPYQHQASCKKIGADCLGFIRGVYRHIYQEEFAHIPPYTRNVHPGEAEELYEGLKAYVKEVELDKVQSGNILLFRMRAGYPARHLGLMIDEQHMIHAAEGYQVLKTGYGNFWRKRCVAVFEFPQLHKIMEQNNG